jgi:hypothetical protein
MIVLTRFGRQRVDDFALRIKKLDSTKTFFCQCQPYAWVILLVSEGDAWRSVCSDVHLDSTRAGSIFTALVSGFQLTTCSFSTLIDDRESSAALTPMIIDTMIMVPSTEA